MTAHEFEFQVQLALEIIKDRGWEKPSIITVAKSTRNLLQRSNALTYNNNKVIPYQYYKNMQLGWSSQYTGKFKLKDTQFNTLLEVY